MTCSRMLFLQIGLFLFLGFTTAGNLAELGNEQKEIIAQIRTFGAWLEGEYEKLEPLKHADNDEFARFFVKDLKGKMHAIENYVIEYFGNVKEEEDDGMLLMMRIGMKFHELWFSEPKMEKLNKLVELQQKHRQEAAIVIAGREGIAKEIGMIRALHDLCQENNERIYKLNKAIWFHKYWNILGTFDLKIASDKKEMAKELDEFMENKLKVKDSPLEVHFPPVIKLAARELKKEFKELKKKAEKKMQKKSKNEKINSPEYLLSERTEIYVDFLDHLESLINGKFPVLLIAKMKHVQEHIDEQRAAMEGRSSGQHKMPTKKWWMSTKSTKKLPLEKLADFGKKFWQKIEESMEERGIVNVHLNEEYEQLYNCLLLNKVSVIMANMLEREVLDWMPPTTTNDRQRGHNNHEKGEIHEVKEKIEEEKRVQMHHQMASSSSNIVFVVDKQRKIHTLAMLNILAEYFFKSYLNSLNRRENPLIESVKNLLKIREAVDLFDVPLKQLEYFQLAEGKAKNDIVGVNAQGILDAMQMLAFYRRLKQMSISIGLHQSVQNYLGENADADGANGMPSMKKGTEIRMKLQKEIEQIWYDGQEGGQQILELPKTAGLYYYQQYTWSAIVKSPVKKMAATQEESPLFPSSAPWPMEFSSASHGKKETEMVPLLEYGPGEENVSNSDDGIAYSPKFESGTASAPNSSKSKGKEQVNK